MDSCKKEYCQCFKNSSDETGLSFKVKRYFSSFKYRVLRRYWESSVLFNMIVLYGVSNRISFCSERRMGVKARYPGSKRYFAPFHSSTAQQWVFLPYWRSHMTG